MLQPFKNITLKMKAATNSGMATDRPSQPSVGLTGDLRYRLVSVDADGLGVLAGATGNVPVGVLMESFDKAGVSSQVCVSGIVEIECGAAVTAGTQVAAGTDGKAAPYHATNNPNAIGTALTSTTAAGQYVSVLI